MFENKTVVVTGAGRGIGRTLALGFAEQGANVLVHYGQSEAGAREVVHRITTQGRKALLKRANLRKADEIANFVKWTYDTLGSIDVWINNAGASANTKETWDMNEIAKFERMIEVDILGTWRCCIEVAPYMREGGCILTTGWDGALSGAPGMVNQLYAMSKGAIISLTRCLAQEYAPHIRVNCIAPGHIENDWSRGISDASQRKIAQRIPMKRWGNAQDILNTALFLASPAASFITGQVILVNGGEVMR